MAASGTKEQLPTLGGQRIKQRKRDEKVKHDPTSFADIIITGMNETDGSMEEISKFIDKKGGGELDYR